jgi:peroxiredoxin (alkyl hydroperoxide reductase subunit C)
MANESIKPRDTLIAAGEAAPDFTLLDQERKEWRLSDAARKGDVVLCFFPFAFTGTCGTEMKCISAEMGAWQKKGATVVGISCDSTFVLKEWAAKEGFRHTMLSDPHRQVCRGYGIFWPEMNVAGRGTVIVGKSAEGRPRVKWSQKREVKSAMNWDEVLAAVS